jgi:hypothetical protein
VILHGPTGMQVQGLTTAATIWITASLGVLCAGTWHEHQFEEARQGRRMRKGKPPWHRWEKAPFWEPLSLATWRGNLHDFARDLASHLRFLPPRSLQSLRSSGCVTALSERIPRGQMIYHAARVTAPSSNSTAKAAPASLSVARRASSSKSKSRTAQSTFTSTSAIEIALMTWLPRPARRPSLSRHLGAGTAL